MVPTLKEEEMFEGVEHLGQSHPASKLQTQDPCLGFLVRATLSSFWKPLLLDKGVRENRCKKSPGTLGCSGRSQGEHQCGLFSLGQFVAKGCSCDPETLLLPRGLV